MRTSRVVLPLCARRATLVSFLPWYWVLKGLLALERCPKKPIPIAGAQWCAWNARRELYQKVGNFVGSVVSPLLANIYLHELDKYMESTYLNLTKVQRKNAEGTDKEMPSTSATVTISWCSGMEQRQKPTPSKRNLEESSTPWG